MPRQVLILVLSAVRDPWKALMEQSMRTWHSFLNTHTQTLFYVGRGGPTSDNVFVSEFDEELHNVGRRTVEAFEHALTIEGWDYLARPHSSIYVHKRRLVEFIEELPDTGVFAGLAVAGDAPFVWGGGGYILSRDVVIRLIEQKGHWDHSVMEDVAVSRLASLLGIPSMPIRASSLNPSVSGSGWDLLCYNGKHGGGTYQNFADIDQVDDQFFFRVKHDADRSVDLQTMQLLFEHLTP